MLAIVKQLDKEKKALQELKEYYEKQKKNYETAVSTVTDYIDKQIDALKKENDELDRQIDKQNKLEELEKAKSQRNKRVYIEGQGFVWQADTEAIKDAQKALDETQRKDELDAEIQALEDYKTAWEDAVKSYQQKQDEATTAQILGEHWEKDILNRRTDNIHIFQYEYERFCDQLNEDVEGSVVDQIENISNLTTQWRESIDNITDDLGRYQDVITSIEEFENASYDRRLEMLSDFVAASQAKLLELRSVHEYPQSSSSRSSSSSGSSGFNATATIPGYGSTGVTVENGSVKQTNLPKGTVVHTDGGDYKIVDHGTTGSTYNPDNGYSSVKVNDKKKSYFKGGVIDYTGEASVHGSPNQSETVFNSTDSAKLYNYIHTVDNLADDITSSVKKLDQTVSNQTQTGSFEIIDIWSKYNISPDTFSLKNIIPGNASLAGMQNQLITTQKQLLSAITTENSSQSLEINIEHISLPNVKDATSFAQEINMKFGNVIKQLLFKKG